MFLIDTGAEISIIKRSCLFWNTEINGNVTYELTGISPCSVKTLGTSKIYLTKGDPPCDIHVVDDDFSIKEDGILGAEFLRKQKTQLCFSDDSIIINNERFDLMDCDDYRKEITLPARLRKLIQLNVANVKLE